MVSRARRSYNGVGAVIMGSFGKRIRLETMRP